MSTHSFDRRDPRDFGFDAALEFVPNNVPALSITSEMANLNPDFRGGVYDYRYLVDMSLRRKLLRAIRGSVPSCPCGTTSRAGRTWGHLCAIVARPLSGMAGGRPAAGPSATPASTSRSCS